MFRTNLNKTTLVASSFGRESEWVSNVSSSPPQLLNSVLKSSVYWTLNGRLKEIEAGFNRFWLWLHWRFHCQPATGTHLLKQTMQKQLTGIQCIFSSCAWGDSTSKWTSAHKQWSGGATSHLGYEELLQKWGLICAFWRSSTRLALKVSVTLANAVDCLIWYNAWTSRKVRWSKIRPK